MPRRPPALATSSTLRRSNQWPPCNSRCPTVNAAAGLQLRYSTRCSSMLHGSPCQRVRRGGWGAEGLLRAAGSPCFSVGDRMAVSLRDKVQRPAQMQHFLCRSARRRTFSRQQGSLFVPRTSAPLWHCFLVEPCFICRKCGQDGDRLRPGMPDTVPAAVAGGGRSPAAPVG